MSEPIELYDASGEPVIAYSPKVVEALVEAGELFLLSPLGDPGASIDVAVIEEMAATLDEEE